MPEFLARVELIGITPEDDAWNLHENLDAYLAVEGFSRTIVGKKERHLPAGTYFGRFHVSTPEVTEKAIRAVRRTGKEGRVLVVEMLDWAAKNLRPVDGTTTSF